MGKAASEGDVQISAVVLRETLHHNPAVVYTCKPGGDYAAMYVAPGVRDMLGHAPQRFTDDPGFWAAGIHPDDRARVFGGLKGLARRGVHTHEYRFRHADGSYRWVRDTLRLVRNEDGTPRKIVGFWIDITGEHGAREAVHASEARLRAILDTVLDGIITIDPDGTVETFNPAAERIFGYKAAEVIGRNVKMLMPPPFRQHHDTYIANYLSTGEARVIGIGREVTGRQKNGHRFAMHLGIAETEVNGRTVFTGCVQDVSARKEAEEALAESHKHVLAILNGLRIGAAVVDEDDKVVFLSDTARRICGKRGTEGLGNDWFTCIPFDAESVARIKAMAERPAREREKVTVRFTPRGRAEFWLEVEVQDDPRAARQRIFLIYDVTELHAAREMLGQESVFEDMVGRSPLMQTVFQQVREVAAGDWTVLIEGETGTGKELVARAIHQLSHRKGGPFVAVNAAGLAESVLTSQLFGHKRGAFTGAVADHKGFFEAAEGGTLFLDEIGDVPMSVQANLLRVLQEWEITRLGETQPRPVDVRVITATNRNLAEEVAAERFRPDLFYRVRVARIHLPPLRERFEDIPLLIGHTLARLRLRSAKAVESVHVDAMRRLTEYAWPGNVRELINAIEFAVIRARGTMLRASDLPPEIAGGGPGPRPHPDGDGAGGREGERGRLVAALERTGGSRVKAARLLGISRATLYRRLREFDLPARR
jgi:PAS domain S-box-containing protein